MTSMYSMRHRTVSVSQYLFVLFLVLIFFFPVAWLFITSLKPTGEIYAWPPRYLPQSPTWQNYRTVLFESRLGLYIINSVLVSGLSTLSVLVFASLAGYALGRLKLKGTGIILIFFLSMSMFPQLAVVPSIFLWFREMGLVNNFLGMIIAYTGLFLPISVWILTSYFSTVPRDIEDSARMDGCSWYRFIHSILIPLSIPGVIASGLICFIQTWNEFLLSLVILSKDRMRTAVVGISLYPGEYSFPWELISTATFLSIVPLFLLTVFFQGRIIGGLTAGAVKS